MASIFWDAKGVLLVDFLETDQAINGVYYAQLLQQLKKQLKLKRREKLSKGVIFHRSIVGLSV